MSYFITGEKRAFSVTFANDLGASETLSSPAVTAPGDVIISGVAVTATELIIAKVLTPVGQGITFMVDLTSATAGWKTLDVLAQTSAGQEVGWPIRILVS